MTTLIIARHGNTFESHETPRRVGARTDPPLTEKGRAQACAIGTYLRDNHLIPDMAYCSQLKRTRETAALALSACGAPITAQESAIFNEIDYGPDENKTEDEVITRIGAEALKNWDEKAVVPPGWAVNPNAIIQNWNNFAAQIAPLDKTILIVTSNGIARFAPYLTGDFESFRAAHSLKIAPGSLCVLRFIPPESWAIESWGIRPPC